MVKTLKLIGKIQTLLLVLGWTASAATLVVTDYLDMEIGTAGQPVSVTNATNNTLPSSGKSGSWSATLSGFQNLKSSNLVHRPPRGPIQIGSNVDAINDQPSTKSYEKEVSEARSLEALVYTLNPTRNVISAGMFFYFASANTKGIGFDGNAWDYDDVFNLENGADYLVFSMQTKGWDRAFGGRDDTPLTFNNHTDTEVKLVANGKVDKWYWVSFNYNGPANEAKMAVYDPEKKDANNRWEKLGEQTCRINSKSSRNPIKWIYLGGHDSHSHDQEGVFFYSDDFMLDTTGKWPFVPDPASGSSDTIAPAPPTGLRVKP